MSYVLARSERRVTTRDTELKTQEVLNEIEWTLIQGNSANNSAYTVQNSPSGFGAAGANPVISQFNGLLEILGAAGLTSDGGSWSGTAVTNYGNAVSINAKGTAYGTSGSLTEQIVRDLGRAMAAQNTPYMPDLLLVSAQQMEVINSFRPSIITMANEGLVGGGSVDKYNTGFSTVTVAYEPQLPAGYMILTNTKLLKRAPLIELGAEPLARVQTQVERMITCEMSLEARVQKSHGLIYNLAY